MKFHRPFHLTISMLACLSFALFLFVTIWDMTVNGWFESANLNVSHFIAGAGKTSLLLRFFLCFASVVFILVWAILDRRMKPVLLKLSAGVVALVVFGYSAIGVERTSKNYDEEKFNEITGRFEEGAPIDLTQIQTGLGEPLVSGEQTILLDARPHAKALLYTYMPSCGYGWHKRVLYLDAHGQMVNFLRMDEP